MLALDTNVLARYYVSEENAPRGTRAEAQAARHILESDAPLFVAKTVLLELEWVLSGVYGFSRGDVLRVLEHVLAMPNVQVEDRAEVDTAVHNLGAALDFADALHHASSRTAKAFLTFDRRRFASRAKRMALTPPVRLPT